MYRFIVLVYALFFLPFVSYADRGSECNVHRCLAVVDAGSSGSRLHVFSYDVDKTNTPVNINEIWEKKIVPGLSTIELENRSVSVYLDRLFADAPMQSMPVFFYSTAGMRLLPKANHKPIYQMITDWFHKQQYWNLVSARTIQGREEGVFAWLATNYQLKLLNQEAKPLVGVMDIGGGSVQIVIPIKTKIANQHADIIELNLYGNIYTVFSHSFLGLGQNEMGHQYYDTSPCYPIEYELPSGEPARGDATACKKEIITLVNNVHYVSRKVKSILALNPVENWYIMGGITYLLNDKIFSFAHQQFTNQELINITDKNVCHQNWSSLEEKNPNNFMLFNYCMLPSFLYALIVHGYGLEPKQVIHFMPATKQVDWTLGVVLQHHQQ